MTLFSSFALRKYSFTLPGAAATFQSQRTLPPEIFASDLARTLLDNDADFVHVNLSSLAIWTCCCLVRVTEDEK